MKAESNPGNTSPAWNHPQAALSISLLFAEPWWVDVATRQAVGKQWLGAMSGYQIYLDQWASVKEWGITIYGHLRSRNMPKTSDLTQMWPEPATDLLRLWINQGYRQNETDPFDPAQRIPQPDIKPPAIRLRRDIRSLTPDELNQYRARLDDVMRVADSSPSSPWQILAYIHTNWCVHYQEAFLFWHRAYLLYMEQMLGMPVPYWNAMAEDANIDGSPDAGIPPAFSDETYVHPGTGETRPNPLRYAAAKDGWSKACTSTATRGNLTDAQCRWVQRDPLLFTTGDDHRVARERQIRMVRIFQNQVVNALTWPVFSQPEGYPGYPWANILAFTPPQPDSLYPNRQDFDGLYEQPHDNWHGWLGPDMGDNAYTAFDPVFWSYHSNIDRFMEVWIRQNPAAQFTGGFPLHPFMGATANAIDEADPRRWAYTNIGDMARDSRGLGYDFGPPVTPDWPGTEANDSGQAADLPAGPALSVIFDGVRCTHESYWIDAFLNQSAPTAVDADPLNPHFIGRFTRIGMGIEDEKGRCIAHGVSRRLDATRTAAALGIVPGSTCQLTLLVRKIATGETLSPGGYQALPGFNGQLIWTGPGIAPQARVQPPAPTQPGSCCHSEPL